MFPFSIYKQKPYWVNRFAYDNTATYNQYDAVWYTVSGVDYWYIYRGTTPITGVIPTTTGRGWTREGTLTLTPIRGPQGIPAEVPKIEYSVDKSSWHAEPTDDDKYKRYTYSDGTVLIEKIQGNDGEDGQSIKGDKGNPGDNAPLLRWQYAAPPPDEDTPLVWRDNYVKGDAWKHYSNDGGITWDVPENILAVDGRDGFDLERQYSTSADGPWEVHDSGQAYVRSRVGNVDPFGPAVNRSGTGHATGDVTESQARAIAKSEAAARYTDEEKAEVAKIEGIVNRLNSIQNEINFVVLDYREGRPIPPLRSQVEAFKKGLLTIGIGTDGVFWSLKAIPARAASGDWADYDPADGHWKGEFAYDLLPPALDAGDYWYNYSTDMWGLYDGTDITHHRTITDILQDFIFIGQFANRISATQHIRNYDNTKFYLSYNHLPGFTQGEVELLSNFVPGTGESVTWVSSNETLNHVKGELQKLIRDNKAEIEGIAKLVGENKQAIGDRKTVVDRLIEDETQARAEDVSRLQGEIDSKPSTSDVNDRINALAPPVGSISITRATDGRSGIATRDDLAGIYIANMSEPHPKIENANRIDFIVNGITIHTNTSWTDDNLLVAFEISQDEADLIGPNIDVGATSVQIEVRFYNGNEQIDRLRVLFGIGPEYTRRLIVLPWSETRTYPTADPDAGTPEGHQLPENYQDFDEIEIIIMDSVGELIPHRFPIEALQDPRRDGAHPLGFTTAGTFANTSFNFNRTTRRLYRYTDGTFVTNLIDRFVFIELERV